MANKRMFSLKVIDSDAFLDMPLSTQCLYFHLNMRADDDGFVGNPKRVQRLIGSSDDDLKLLIAKRFLLTFEDGVIVIKHWRIHNTLSANRYNETVYLDEKKSLLLKDNKAYSFNTGVPIDDSRQIEISKRQSRRKKDEHLSSTGLELGLGLDKGLDLDKDIDKEEELGSSSVIDINLESDPFKKRIDEYTDDPKLRESLIQFVDMMKNKTDTDFFIDNLNFVLNRLDELSSDIDEKISIVNHSTDKHWNSFYPVKKAEHENKMYPDWWNYEEKPKTQESEKNKIIDAYKATVTIYEMNLIDDIEFDKRKQNYMNMYRDITGEEMEV